MGMLKPIRVKWRAGDHGAPPVLDTQWRGEVPAPAAWLSNVLAPGCGRLPRAGTGPCDLVPRIPDCYSLDLVFFKGLYDYDLLPGEVFMGGCEKIRRWSSLVPGDMPLNSEVFFFLLFLAPLPSSEQFNFITCL